MVILFLHLFVLQSWQNKAELSVAASITPWEQHTLHLLNASLANQEITKQCSIFPSTVKTHLENMYRKLRANSYVQAIEQARMLNLV